MFSTLRVSPSVPVQIACALSKATHILDHVLHFRWETVDRFPSPRRLSAFDDVRFRLVAQALWGMKKLFSLLVVDSTPIPIQDYIAESPTAKELVLETALDLSRLEGKATCKYKYISYEDTAFPRGLLLASHSSLTTWEIGYHYLQELELLEVWKTQPPPNLREITLLTQPSEEHLATILEFLDNAPWITDLTLSDYLGEIVIEIPPKILPNLTQLFVGYNRQSLRIAVGRPVVSLAVDLYGPDWSSIEASIKGSTRPLQSLKSSLVIGLFCQHQVELLELCRSLTVFDIHLMANSQSSVVSVHLLAIQAFTSSIQMNPDNRVTHMLLNFHASLPQLEISKMTITLDIPSWAAAGTTHLEKFKQEIQAIHLWLMTASKSTNRRLRDLSACYMTMDGVSRLSLQQVSSQEWHAAVSGYLRLDSHNEVKLMGQSWWQD